MSNSILKKYGLSLEDAEAILDRAPVTALVYVFDHDSFYEESMAEFGCVLIEDLVSEVDELKKERQGLISGADAYELIGKRIEVEALCQQSDGSFKWEDAKHLPACDILNDGFDFRLKPRTIKLELEIPAPFEPKEGDMVWFISDYHTNGYSSVVFEDLAGFQFGCWRTEEEIKQVVAALRGGIKG